MDERVEERSASMQIRARDERSRSPESLVFAEHPRYFSSLARLNQH